MDQKHYGKPIPVAELVIDVQNDMLWFHYVSDDAKRTVEALLMSDEFGRYTEDKYGNRLNIKPNFKGKEREIAKWLCQEAGGIVSEDES